MIFGFLLSTVFFPDISGAATAPRWAFAAVALPLSMFGEKPGTLRFTAVHLCGLMFIWYAAISLSWTANFYDGLDALIKLVIIAEAFVYGSNPVSLRPVIIGFGLGMWVSSLVILTGMDVPHVTDNAGLFVNSNSMGEIAGLVLVAAAASRIWWLIPGILPAFILSQCRGAFVAVACALLIWIWQRSRWAVFAIVPLGLSIVTAFGSMGSIHDRLTLWGDILPHLSLLGHGIGSFYTLYPLFGSIDTLFQRPEHLHNDWLEVAFETGAVGFVALLCFVRGIYSRGGLAARAVLATLAIQACFGFPLHMAATAILGAIVAGHACACRSDLRDPVAGSRMGIRRWLFPDPPGIGG